MYRTRCAWRLPARPAKSPLRQKARVIVRVVSMPTPFAASRFSRIAKKARPVREYFSRYATKSARAEAASST